MKITKKQLRKLIRERVAGGQHMSEPAHSRAGLGKNVADVDFPILVRYAGRSEVLYDRDSLDELLGDIGSSTPYSLDSLSDVEVQDVPMGRGIEMYGEGRVLKEYSDYASYADLQDYMDDIADMLETVANKYAASGAFLDQEKEAGVLRAGPLKRALNDLLRLALDIERNVGAAANQSASKRGGFE